MQNKIYKIQILGPFNSGTNLITKILLSFIKYVNIENIVKINKEGHTLFWKHTLHNLETYINNKDNIIYIICYRNAFSWFASIMKTNYEITFNTNEKNITSNIIFKKQKYDNLLCLWLNYYNNYKILFNNNSIKFLIINYEKIININNVKNYIQIFLTNLCMYMNIHNIEITINNYIQSNEFINVLYKSSKNHGSPVNNIDEAYFKYNSNVNKYKQILLLYIKNNKNDNIINNLNEIKKLIIYYENN